MSRMISVAAAGRLTLMEEELGKLQLKLAKATKKYRQALAEYGLPTDRSPQFSGVEVYEPMHPAMAGKIATDAGLAETPAVEHEVTPEMQALRDAAERAAQDIAAAQAAALPSPAAEEPGTDE